MGGIKLKKSVESSKQTVWLLTMLTVMVVLSAYYLVSEPLIPIDMVDQKFEDEVVITELNKMNTEEFTEIIDLTDEIGINNNDLFIGIKMERSKNRSKQLDQLYTMMQSNVSEEAIAEIQDRIEQLQSIEESEFVLEKLIISDGYGDAIVLTNENGVDVIIQTDSLSKAEAVRIIKSVSERLGVPALNVHIKPVN